MLKQCSVGYFVEIDELLSELGVFESRGPLIFGRSVNNFLNVLLQS